MKKSILLLAIILTVVMAISVSAAIASSASVTITSPTSGSTVSGSAAKISANCSGDDHKISSVKYIIDGSGEIDMSGPNGSTSGTWTANWDSTKVSNGSHTIKCREYLSNGSSVTSSSITVTVSNSSSGSGSYVVIAYNDLGMHCACPNNDLMILLPPFNSIRAQVFKKGSRDPSLVTSGVTVEYKSNENTEANLLQDEEYLKWLDNANKFFPTSAGFPTISRTNIVGLTGNKLNGTMKVEGNHYEATGIPNYPAIDPNGIYDFFGQKRNPYLSADVTVKNTSGTVLAKTTTVVPVSFGGCCNCHYKLAQDVLGKSNPTPDESFKVMSDIHKRDTGVDFYSMKPIRCSSCHADPAVDGPNATNKNCTTTFSQALHLFHAKSALVKSQYSANIDNDCYACHPDSNNVKCYRGLHQNTSYKGLNMWCSDCHGTILNRKDRTDYKTPWMYNSLPKCKNCHSAPNTETSLSTTGIFGLFLASTGHENKVLCTTCHGAPHAELPASNPYANDNGQSIALQGSSNGGRAIGVCDVCHTGRSTSWGMPPHWGD